MLTDIKVKKFIYLLSYYFCEDLESKLFVKLALIMS